MVEDAKKLQGEGSQEVELQKNLEIIVANQADRLILLGFHREVYSDLDEEEAKRRYLADCALPTGIAQLAVDPGRFDTPVVVEPRVPFIRQHELAKKLKDLQLTSAVEKWGKGASSQIVSHGIPPGDIINVTEFPTDKPYLIWTHNARKYSPLATSKAIELFANDEVGATQLEVTALFLQYPQYFDKFGIVASGSYYEGGGVRGFPFISVFDSGTSYSPGFHINWPDKPSQIFGALSRGKEIVRLGSLYIIK